MLVINIRRVIFIAFYIFVIVIYPFIYRLYGEDSNVALLNKVILFLLICLVFIHYIKRAILNIKSNIDVLHILAIFYLLISLFIYASIGKFSLGDAFREILYSIVPILFYFFAKIFNKKEIELFINLLFISICFVTIIGVLNMLNLNISSTVETALKSKTYNFQSFYGSIIMGYSAQMIFALLLFDQIKIKKFKLFLITFFLIISALTLQRSSFLGIGLAIIVYSTWKNKGKFKTIFLLGISILILFVIITTIDLSIFFGFDFRVFFFSEIHTFNYSSVAKDRANQNIIYNSHNFFNILFGEGFGKYSPNNFQTINKMPDANYYRIYNELGIVGGLFFFMPFIIMLLKAFVRRNSYLIYFIGFTLIAFFFNRVLWAIPLNFIIYTFLGISENREYKEYLDIIRSKNS